MNDDDFRPRVLVTKIGFDGHDRGSRIVAAACAMPAWKSIYTPPWQEIAAVVKLAIEEDVDVIGISSLATDHLLVPKLMTALREAGLGDIARDRRRHRARRRGSDAARRRALREVFHPGSTLDDIADPHPRVRARGASRGRRRGGLRMNKPIDPTLLGAERRGGARRAGSDDVPRRASAPTSDVVNARASRSSRSTPPPTGAASRLRREPRLSRRVPDYTRGIYPIDASRPHAGRSAS